MDRQLIYLEFKPDGASAGAPPLSPSTPSRPTATRQQQQRLHPRLRLSFRRAGCSSAETDPINVPEGLSGDFGMSLNSLKGLFGDFSTTINYTL